jgi:hypothetical protein
MGLVGDALSELGAQRRELESWRELGGQILDELESGTVSEATTEVD